MEIENDFEGILNGLMFDISKINVKLAPSIPKLIKNIQEIRRELLSQVAQGLMTEEEAFEDVKTLLLKCEKAMNDFYRKNKK